MSALLDYTVHYQRGTRVGTRSLRMIHVKASGVEQARRLARTEADAEGLLDQGYRVVRVDHFDDETGRLKRDW